MKRVALKTVGCRLNQAETAAIAGQFRRCGCDIVSWNSPCDLAVINTCAVTAKAVKDGIRLARVIKKNNPNAIVALTGCAAEVDNGETAAACNADICAKQCDKNNLPALLGLQGDTNACRAADIPHFTTTRAIVKVQDGCDFFCSYCIVPYARKRSSGRPLSEIITEIRNLCEKGFKEIVLTGANLGCYRDGSHTLIDLLKKNRNNRRHQKNPFKFH